MAARPTLLEIQREFERKVGVMTLTGEYELVCCFLDEEWLTPSQLQVVSRLSPAALTYTLAKMVARAVAIQRRNPRDGRSTQYRLTDQVRDLVLKQHAGYLDVARSAAAKTSTDNVSLGTYQSYIYKGQQVSHLTAEFQILLYLYVAVGLGNHEIAHFIDVSPAKFNRSLSKLGALGLIKVSPNPADRRSKLYGLAQSVRAELDRLHDQVGNWLDAQCNPAASHAALALNVPVQRAVDPQRSVIIHERR
jgi:DNA-binding MarR family transcriptional regulator